DLARADAACEARAAEGASAEVVVEGRVAVGVGDDDARVPRRAARLGGASPVRPLHLRAGEDGGVEAGEERAGRECSEGAGAGRAAQPEARRREQEQGGEPADEVAGIQEVEPAE